MKSGALLWKYETDNFINGTPAVSGNNVVFGGCDGFLHVVSKETGKSIKKIDLQSYIAASPAIQNDVIYLGHYGNKIVSVDMNSGKILWSYFYKDFPYFSSPAVVDGSIIIGGRDRNIHCINSESGELKWRYNAGAKVDSSPVISGRKIVVGTEGGRLLILSKETGNVEWKYDIGSALTGSPAVVENRIVVGSTDGTLYACGKRKE